MSSVPPGPLYQSRSVEVDKTVDGSQGRVLTVFPCGMAVPLVATVDYSGDDFAANAILTKLGADGKV